MEVSTVKRYFDDPLWEIVWERTQNRPKDPQYFIVGFDHRDTGERIMLPSKLYMTVSSCDPIQKEHFDCGYPETVEAKVMDLMSEMDLSAQVVLLRLQENDKTFVTEYLGVNLHEVLCGYADDEWVKMVSENLQAVVISVGLNMVELAKLNWYMYDCVPQKIGFTQQNRTKTKFQRLGDLFPVVGDFPNIGALVRNAAAVDEPLIEPVGMDDMYFFRTYKGLYLNAQLYKPAVSLFVFAANIARELSYFDDAVGVFRQNDLKRKEFTNVKQFLLDLQNACLFDMKQSSDMEMWLLSRSLP